jgi:hypothetical protein
MSAVQLDEHPARPPGADEVTMVPRLRILTILASLVAAMAFGCSSPSPGATMSVHLVDAPADYQAVSLDVRRVEIHGPDGWVTLGTPNRVVDLLKLTGGVSETLADHAPLEAGHYTQLRLVLGTANTLTLSDGSVVDLKVPSGTQSGVKLNVDFDVAGNTTRDVFIDFDAHRSIFVHAAGRSGKYLLRPVVRAVDRIVTGAVTGTVTDAATGAAMEGVTVTAQRVDASGEPSVVRSAQTGVDGRYTLDLLPAGGSYHVVTEVLDRSEPLLGTVTVYGPTASAPIAIGSGAPTATRDVALTIWTSGSGTRGGSVTPMATDADADLVSARQTLAAGGAARNLIVREVSAAGGPLGERYDLGTLPAGSYDVVLIRRSVDGLGEETASRVERAVTVAAGASTVDFALP